MTALAPVGPTYVPTVAELQALPKTFGLRFWLRLSAELEQPRDAIPLARRAVLERRPDIDSTRLDWSGASVQFAPQRWCYYVNVPTTRAPLEGDGGTPT